MKYVISKLALQELEESREYYNLQKNGLGDEFAQYIKNSIDAIVRLSIAHQNRKPFYKI